MSQPFYAFACARVLEEFVLDEHVNSVHAHFRVNRWARPIRCRGVFYTRPGFAWTEIFRRGAKKETRMFLFVSGPPDGFGLLPAPLGPHRFMVLIQRQRNMPTVNVLLVSNSFIASSDIYRQTNEQKTTAPLPPPHKSVYSVLVGYHFPKFT